MKNKKSRGIRIQIRIILTVFLILAQLFLILTPIINFASDAVWFYRFASFLSIVTVIYILNIRGNQSYKIMWIIFILIFPVFGVFAYLLWGGGRMFPHHKKRMEYCTKKYFSQLPDKENVFRALNYSDIFHYRQAEYLRREGGFQVYSNCESEFFSPGENLMPRLLEELENAEKYIFLEFFILAEGQMWDSIHNILKKKAATGVEIKIIFDDFGSIKRQYKGFVKNLINEGIEVSVFNPITPSINIFMNNRNHRKIIVIDGKVAITGGINIGDEYINKFERFGYWMDDAILIRGEAANGFLAMFCCMWEFITRREINIKQHLYNFSSSGKGFYIPYCDDPLGKSNPAEGIYMQIINNAQKYVYIATPYLILDSNMINSLCLAAKSGVEVKIITPKVPDKSYVHPVTQYYYSELLESGIRIFEYTPGFIHSKLFVSDDNVATVGTINMDYRSFYFHFECGVWMSGTNTIKDIKNNLTDVINVSEEICLEVWKKRPIRYKLKQYLLHLFAPLM